MAEHVVSKFADDNNLKITVEKGRKEIESLFYANFVENWNKYCKYGVTAMYSEELSERVDNEN